MVAEVRSGLNAVAHAAKRVGDNLRERAGVRAVSPQLCAHDRERGEHDELDQTPEPDRHRQAPHSEVTKRVQR